MGPEDRLIAWLRELTAASPRPTAGRATADGPRLGDDAAILPRDAWAVTVDQQIEGTHFVAGTPGPVVARRLLAVNLSDLAATGAEPVYALLAAAGPPDYPWKPFFRALVSGCRRHEVELAGGDLGRSTHLAASLTLFGRRPRGGKWLSRRGAETGDGLWLGGPVGLSAAGRLLLERGATIDGRRVELPDGLPASVERAARRAVRRHLSPRPQLELGNWLGRRRRTAVIDVSDGVLLDLERLCRESGCGAAVDAGAELWLAPGLPPLARALDQDAIELALAGGEDYVLLFALPPSVKPPQRFGCRHLGQVVPWSGTGPRVSLPEGRKPPTTLGGWDHLQT